MNLCSVLLSADYPEKKRAGNCRNASIRHPLPSKHHQNEILSGIAYIE
jgi:hypothetical protein